MKKYKALIVLLTLLMVLSLTLAILLTQKLISLRSSPSTTGTTTESAGTIAPSASQATSGVSNQTSLATSGASIEASQSAQTTSSSPIGTTGQTISTTQTVPSGFITAERAASIAINQIGKGALVIKSELEFDENPPKYELSLTFGGYRYELEIHARTGAIIDFEKEELDGEKDPD